ncbi:DNA-binding protein [Streptomyces acidiscabies]|uniref:DNA-binding protein n=1 Tax=Streptomyces acidiscabies TaxID=42234 RepID=A0A0L0K9Z9_9ACTN|nr:helix-turn-helix transcriptional regulator [Streptomyces acidiscabies]KND34499.1 DNA-binding protein [Streptomyces acidiscabies]
MTGRASTVLARKLGGELLRLREAAGLTQPQAAGALSATAAKVAKMERGWVPIREPDVRALCKLYGVEDEAVVERLLAIAKADRERRKAKGWWNQYPQLQEMIEYIALEDLATRIKAWQLALIPGLLQTPDYARALAVGAGNWENLDDIDLFVDSRVKRQARLAGDNPLELWVLVHESALRQLVGGREVMRDQLAHLIEMGHRPNVKVQVVPHHAGAHAGMTGTFSIVSFAEEGALDVVYADTTWHTVWLESDTDAERHSRLFDRISRAGLAQQNSIRLIEGIMKEMQ